MRVVGITAATKIGPDAPTLVSVTDIGTNREFDNGAVNVAFTRATTNPTNAAVSFIVTASDGTEATGTTSPIKIENLSSNTSLTFDVRAVNAIGIAGNPSATSASTLVTTVPAKPDIGIAGSGNAVGYVPFSITNNGGRDIIEYTVTGNPSGTATGTSGPITVSNLSNGTAYSFSVVARNANGTSVASNYSNSITPVAPVSSGGGGGGGGGVIGEAPTSIYYCYSSTCLSSYGSSQYAPAPTLSYITTSANNSTTSSTSYYQRTTTVVYCATNETAAASGARQSDCEGAVVPNVINGCTDPNNIVFGPCPDAGSFIWVTTTEFSKCSGTYFQTYASQAAWQTYTEYDCAGNVVSNGSGPTCGQDVLLSSTQIDGQCGYTKPAVSSGGTGYYPSTGGGTSTGSSSSGSGAQPATPATSTTVVTTSDTGLLFALLDAYPTATIGYIGPTDTWVISIPTSTSSGGGGGCFVFGTKITMADGSFKNIEDLKIGDELRTFDIPGAPDSDKYEDWLSGDIWSTTSTDSFKVTTTTVKHHRTGPVPLYYNINNKYKVTHEHLIFVNRGGIYRFIDVKRLKIGDKFITEDRKEIEIFDIQLVNSGAFTVELDVEDKDFYFADGILAHNIIYAGNAKF
jgi:hypothetical protein